MSRKLLVTEQSVLCKCASSDGRKKERELRRVHWHVFRSSQRREKENLDCNNLLIYGKSKIFQWWLSPFFSVCSPKHIVSLQKPVKHLSCLVHASFNLFIFHCVYSTHFFPQMSLMMKKHSQMREGSFSNITKFRTKPALWSVSDDDLHAKNILCAAVTHETHIFNPIDDSFFTTIRITHRHSQEVCMSLQDSSSGLV
jgi:hypothetical protein